MVNVLSKELTKRQQDILDFIITCIRVHGCPPTIAEVGKEFGISSTNGVNDHLVALERKGFIERSPKARGIRVIDHGGVPLYGTEVGMLPLLGRIAAGQPLLAQEYVETYLPVAPAFSRPGNYCLRVSGESMIEDNILDGDIILIDRSRRPRTGDIVVALVANEEATVKRWYPHGDMIELRPANATMSPMLYPAQDVELQGVVVGLQRTF
jgi:repressor LexA